MIIAKPRDYDETQAATTGSGFGVELTPGGHPCKILSATLTEKQYSDGNKAQILSIRFDIEEQGDLYHYYQQKYNYQRQFASDVKWQGIYEQPLYDKEGHTNRFFKGLITSVENSNAPYKFNWDTDTLKYKKIGFVFQEQPFVGRDGTVINAVRAAFACDYDGAESIPAPKPKELRQSDRLRASNAQNGLVASNDASPFAAQEDKLPWET